MWHCQQFVPVAGRLMEQKFSDSIVIVHYATWAATVQRNVSRHSNGISSQYKSHSMAPESDYSSSWLEYSGQMRSAAVDCGDWLTAVLPGNRTVSLSLCLSASLSVSQLVIGLSMLPSCVPCRRESFYSLLLHVWDVPHDLTSELSCGKAELNASINWSGILCNCKCD